MAMVPYSQYHGLGNAFLVLDCRTNDTSPGPEDARIHCPTMGSSGVDGLLCIEEGRGGASFHMRVLNADGSEPEMCGNGIRCVVKHVVDQWGPQTAPLAISTAAGIRQAQWVLGEDGKVESVSVSMGKPSRIPEEIPVQGASARIAIQLGEDSHELECVSMGNPHAIRFGSSSRDLAERIGPPLSASPVFPEGVNIGFARIETPTRIHLVVHERGCGVTEACGTGACACVVAAVDDGRSPAGEDVSVILPGGILKIRVEKDRGDVWMTGPAVHVRDGHLSLAAETTN